LRATQSLLAGTVGLILAGASIAQSVAPTTNAGIEEIVVMARTTAALAELKLDSPSDLVAQIPNLQVNGIVGAESPLFSLRGVSLFD